MKKRKPSTYGYAVLGVVFVFVIVNWAAGWLHKADTSALPPLTAAGKPYAAALEDRLQAKGPIWVGKAGLDPQEAHCVAPSWTMLVDPDVLDHRGIDPQEFADHPDAAFRAAGLGWEDATRLRAAYERCGLTSVELARRSVSRTSGTSEDPERQAIRTCIAERVTPEFADHAFNASLTAGGLTANDRDLTMEIRDAEAYCTDTGS